MDIAYGIACIVAGLLNIRLMREAQRTGETQFRSKWLKVRKADEPGKFTGVIVTQAVVSFLLFLLGMYWLNPPA
jgi:hypothetical protein